MEEKITLRELRERAGRSIADVAAALGVSVQAVSNYENGIRSINIEQVLILSELLEETAEEIIKAQLNSRCAREGNPPSH